MSFELYNAPQSTCSQKVRITLHEKRLPFAEFKLDLFKGDQLTKEYKAINPNAVVPSLVHDAQVIVDSSVIMEYLNELVPEPPLAPSDAYGRAKMREWLRFFEEVPTPAIRVPSYNLVFLRDFFLKMGRTGYSDTEMSQSINRLRLTVERMEATLSDDRDYLLRNYSLADICVLPTFLRMNDIGLRPLWANAPGVSRWFDTLKERWSVVSTMYPGSLLSEKYGEPVDVDLDRYTGR